MYQHWIFCTLLNIQNGNAPAWTSSRNYAVPKAKQHVTSCIWSEKRASKKTNIKAASKLGMDLPIYTHRKDTNHHCLKYMLAKKVSCEGGKIVVCIIKSFELLSLVFENVGERNGPFFKYDYTFISISSTYLNFLRPWKAKSK